MKNQFSGCVDVQVYVHMYYMYICLGNG